MKVLESLVHSIVLFITNLPLVLLLLVLEKSADTPATPPLSQAEIGEIQQLLIDNDPRLLLESEDQEVRLTESEVNALLTYVKNSNPRLSALAVAADLMTDSASLSLSIPLQAGPVRSWFNMQLNTRVEGDVLAVESITFGELTLPASLYRPIARHYANLLSDEEGFQLLGTVIDSIRVLALTEDAVRLSLDWQGENLDSLRDQARNAFLSEAESVRLRRYHEHLVAVTRSFPAQTRVVRLNDFLRPLFAEAQSASEAGADPMLENRAVFIIMTTYLSELTLEQLIGDTTGLSTPGNINVVVESRQDLARHIVSSAAIAASAGVELADILSIYKEVHDARYRTGFSFTDIAANQAGAALGNVASRSREDALRFQVLIQGSLNESDYLPPLTGLDEGMTEAEFNTRYGSRNSETYQQRLQAITTNIAARPLFQAMAQ